MTAGRVHEIVSEALILAMHEAEGKDSGALEQKILLARLAAEGVSAYEDLGGLAWAVSQRSTLGILRAYVQHETHEARRVFERIANGAHIRSVLNLPNRETFESVLSEDIVETIEGDLGSLNEQFKDAARRYLVPKPNVVKIYNKIKHGFPMLVRLDKLGPVHDLYANWQNDPQIITAVRPGPQIEVRQIELTPGMIESFKLHIAESSATARNVCALFQFLTEQGVPESVLRWSSG
jgi:hypothetical protein